MQAMIRTIRAFLKSDDGPTATEYAVLLGLIILVAVGAINLLGSKVSTTFAGISEAIPTG
jgi:pilus assembly protein Flp/PilA